VRAIKNKMDEQRASKLRSVLRQLNMISTEIDASVVISTDGLVLAEMLGENIEPDRFGAMCATLLALAKRAATETSSGDLKLVLVEGTNGTMLIVRAGDNGVLALRAKPKSNLGMIFLEARKKSKLIAEIL